MVLNSLRSIRSKFKNKYGELVICCDSGSWRKDVFPFYKAARAKTREESKINWPSVFEAVENIKNDLDQFFPYKVIRVKKAEGDDVIATIARNNIETTMLGLRRAKSPTLIVSTDKDFIQLHCEGVEQYDTVNKRWIQSLNPEQYLFEHIVKGDAGDGIPNIKSPDNSFVHKIRQTPIRKEMLVYTDEFAKPEHPLYRNWTRNKQLIDLSLVPEEIQSKILEEYKKPKDETRKHIFNYFMKNKLKHLMEYINDF